MLLSVVVSPEQMGKCGSGVTSPGFVRRAPCIKSFFTLHLEEFLFGGVRLALTGSDFPQKNGILLPRGNKMRQELPGVSGTWTMVRMFCHVNLPRCDLDKGVPDQFGLFYRWFIFILQVIPRHVCLRRESVQLVASLLCIRSGKKGRTTKSCPTICVPLLLC